MESKKKKKKKCNTAIGLPDYVAGAFLSRKNAFKDAM